MVVSNFNWSMQMVEAPYIGFSWKPAILFNPRLGRLKAAVATNNDSAKRMLKDTGVYRMVILRLRKTVRPWLP